MGKITAGIVLSVNNEQKVTLQNTHVVGCPNMKPRLLSEIGTRR